MKKLAVFILLSALLAAWPTWAKAGWLIEQGPLHASAHGQLSCQDCHQNVADSQRHPDLIRLNQVPDQAARAQMCAQCHDDAQTIAQGGRHGGREITSPAQAANCLACHRPHHQPPAAARPKAFNPARPMIGQCGACHRQRAKLPGPAAADAKCAACHLQDASRPAASRQNLQAMCLSCHDRHQGQTIDAVRVDVADLAQSPHADLSCLDCHRLAAQYPHDGQKAVDCRQCHQPHRESQIHDAHAGVSCQACHLAAAIPVRQGGQVLWRLQRPEIGPTKAHQLRAQSDQDSCRRCHAPGNQVGAAATVLPAKSALCIPCHAATLTVGDWPSGLALAALIAGLLLRIGLWLAAPAKAAPLHALGKRPTAPLGRRWWAGLKALALDGLLQRRLWRAAKGRWLIHGLIFFPLLGRMIWGLAALAASRWLADWPPTWRLLDKNDPLTAFVFDLGGALLVCGVLLAVGRRLRARGPRLPGLPRPDYPALILLGLAIVSGFWLEGARMAMTGAQQPLAFVGAALAAGMAGWDDLPRLYGWFWQAHAIIWCAFVAYLPFGRMPHMIITPAVLAVNAAANAGHDQ